MDLPTPVPPSTTRCSLRYIALVTLASICSCSGLCSNPEKALENGPFTDRSFETVSSERSANFGSARRFSGVDSRADSCSRSRPVSPTIDLRVSPSIPSPARSPLIDQRLRAARLERYPKIPASCSAANRSNLMYTFLVAIASARALWASLCST